MSEQKLSERVGHDPACNSVYRTAVAPVECDCWVGELVALEAKLEEMRQRLLAKANWYEADQTTWGWGIIAQELWSAAQQEKE